MYITGQRVFLGMCILASRQWAAASLPPTSRSPRHRSKGRVTRYTGFEPSFGYHCANCESPPGPRNAQDETVNTARLLRSEVARTPPPAKIQTADRSGTYPMARIEISSAVVGKFGDTQPIFSARSN